MALKLSLSTGRAKAKAAALRARQREVKETMLTVRRSIGWLILLWGRVDVVFGLGIPLA